MLLNKAIKCFIVHAKDIFGEKKGKSPLLRNREILKLNKMTGCRDTKYKNVMVLTKQSRSQ
jgi:hypothetical protein